MRQETKALTKYKYHEHWINSLHTARFELDQSKALIDYSILFGQNPEAYSFYRHQLNRLYQLQQHNITEEFFQIFTKIKTANLEVYNQIITRYSQNEFSEKFRINRDHSYQVANLLVDNQLHPQLLFYYQQVYETESVLDILLTLATYLKHNRVDFIHEGYRDRRGKLQKGRTIQYIVSGLRDYEEICKNITNGYRPKVRNLIGHNDYKFKGDEIYDLENNFIIYKKELLSSLYSIQEIQNTILSFFASTASQSLFEDGIGCIGCSYETNLGTKEIILPIYVLWCFYNEKTYKNICKNITINLNSQELSTQIGKIRILGKSTEDLNTLLLKSKIFKVKVFSIRPIMSLDKKIAVQTIGMHDIEYEVIDSYFEDVEIKKIFNKVTKPMLGRWAKIKALIFLIFYKIVNFGGFKKKEN